MELNRILRADCMDIMHDIPDKYFELACVDPPYGLKSTNFVTARLKKREDKKWRYIEEKRICKRHVALWRKR
jgi:site-specific DNA-methyltransferase (adenine-specific)